MDYRVLQRPTDSCWGLRAETELCSYFCREIKVLREEVFFCCYSFVLFSIRAIWTVFVYLFICLFICFRDSLYTLSCPSTQDPPTQASQVAGIISIPYLASIWTVMCRRWDNLVSIRLGCLTKYHNLGFLQIFFMVLEAGKSKIKAPADLVSGEFSLLHRQPSSHSNLTWWKGQGHLLKGMNLIHEGFCHIP
jgi:hypothetical protein